MGRELYEHDAGFRAVIRHADKIVHARCGESVSAAIFAEDKSRHLALDRLLHSHVAIFMVEYALAKTLIDRGVQADMVLGASLGAFAAATVVGCVDPDIALSAVIEQAVTLEARCQAGCMVAVMGERERFLSPELLALCEHGASNFAAHSVLALPQSNLAAVEVYLRERGLAFQQLPVRFAFHSRWIDEASASYQSFLKNLPIRQPALPFVCCATGETLHALPPNYFWSVVREPILFQQAIQNLESYDSYRYIDLSPGGSMATFLKYALAADSKSDVRSIMSSFGSDMDRLDKLVSDRQLAARSSSAKFAPVTPRHSGSSAHHAVESRHMKACIFPGQGSQFKGMGGAVFPLFPELVKQASDILGYSLEDVCVNDRQGLLSKTQYTQPALYVVNALHYLKEWGPKSVPRPDFLAGHSLGEYNALFAAGVFSFETGLRLVKKRGELMGASTAGGMAAVLGVAAADIRAMLDEHGLAQIDVANFNTPTQTVIAGDKAALAEAAELFARRNLRCVVLNVSAAFHSRHMREAQAEFAEFLRSFSFKAPEIPVIANTTARPYEPDRIAETLAAQIATPVRWVDSIRYLLGRGEMAFQEIGASLLSKMVLEIKATEIPIVDSAPEVDHAPHVDAVSALRRDDAKADITEVIGNGDLSLPLRVSAMTLGSQIFRRRYDLQYAYMAGAMYRGVASADLVIKMGKAGFLSFFGAGGLSREKIEANIARIQTELNAGQPYGMNLLANYEYPAQEEAVVELYLKHGIKNVEAAAFMQMTPALMRYRLQGLRLNERGDVVCTHRVVAKVSRPEVAKAFMSPPPAHIVDRLLERGLVTPQQAEWSKRIPVSHDICVEADSGGHTDGGIAAVMLPPLLRMRDELQRTHAYAEPLCMGLAGGIGGPEAAAAAFLLGADFITTGSINQCTVEAGMSDDGKSMLQEIDIHDTEYAPAGDMFEIGAQVQVMKKSVFFPARANKLLSLYRHYESLDDIPSRTRNQLEGTFFKKSFDEIWGETANYFRSIKLDHEIAKAEANTKHKMALVFRWYFAYSTRLAIEGKGEDRVNYQIQTGPALGSFNQWVKGTELEPWTKRHVDHIAFKLMDATAEHLTRSFSRFASH
ncbi:ACP S-malonyltransferase [Dyella humi]|uniref:[acyl-carrier-protein] S-malonyltransferase n=2 Tax=Dyella humi TaxID=1770547 RepID=A0ABW8IDH2_9GAMM